MEGSHSLTVFVICILGQFSYLKRNVKQPSSQTCRSRKMFVCCDTSLKLGFV
jgi:hypothetical protein